MHGLHSRIVPALFADMLVMFEMRPSAIDKKSAARTRFCAQSVRETRRILLTETKNADKMILNKTLKRWFREIQYIGESE